MPPAVDEGLASFALRLQRLGDAVDPAALLFARGNSLPGRCFAAPATLTTFAAIAAL